MSAKSLCRCLAIVLCAVAVPSFAEEKKDERGGTCDDAKKQFEYYCEKKGHQDDVVMQAPIACNNAKRNMAAACEGKGEQDYKYEFKESK